VEQVNAELPSGIELGGRDHEYRGTIAINFNFDAGRNGASREGMQVVQQAINELLGKFTTLRNVTVEQASHRR